MMSYCLQYFIQEHAHIERSTQKELEIWSPVALIRHLKQVKPNGVSVAVKLMTEQIFNDYGAMSAFGSYRCVGYASVRQLNYNSADIHNIGRMSSSGQQAEDYAGVIKSVHPWRGGVKPLGTPKQQPRTGTKLAEAKVKDLRSLLIYMTGDDKLYMKRLVDSHLSM